MMVVDVSTDPELTIGSPRVLFPGTQGPPGAGGRPRYSVKSDGEKFLFSADMLQSQETEPTAGTLLQINVVLNWFEESHRASPGQLNMALEPGTILGPYERSPPRSARAGEVYCLLM